MTHGMLVQGGALLFFDVASRELVRRIAMPSSVVAVQWHPKLNQILLGIGGAPCHCGHSLAFLLNSVIFCGSHRSVYLFLNADLIPPAVCHN